MTDYKELCDELVTTWDQVVDMPISFEQRRKELCYRIERIVSNARAALLKDQEEPTRRQLMMLADDMGMALVGDAAEYAHAVLARWGNHPGSPDSSTQPS